MMAANQLPSMVVLRLGKEIQTFKSNPPVGVTLSHRLDELHHVDATITGEEGTPYEGGVFKLLVTVHSRYPFEPPKVKFITRVYHPNIDGNGLICLDLLKSPPGGGWRPVLNVAAVVTSIRLLLASPNPLDPLEPEIAREYVYNRSLYETKAKEWTKKYAMSTPA